MRKDESWRKWRMMVAERNSDGNMGIRSAGAIFPDFLFLSLFSSTLYFIMALYCCSQQEFWNFTRARI